MFNLHYYHADSSIKLLMIMRAMKCRFTIYMYTYIFSSVLVQIGLSGHKVKRQNFPQILKENSGMLNNSEVPNVYRA